MPQASVTDEDIGRMMEADIDAMDAAVPAVPQQVGLLPNPMAAWASRLVDLKGVARPPMWDGRDATYSEWKYKFEATMSLLDLDEGMRRFVGDGIEDVIPLSAMTERDRAYSKLLFNILLHVTGGKALSLVRLGERNNGFAAWQRIYQAYEPDEGIRKMSMLSAILTPSWEQGSFWEHLLRWERAINRYEEATRGAVNDEVKCSVVQRWAPPHIKAYLRVAGAEVFATYRGLRAGIKSYVERCRVFDEFGQKVTSTPEVVTGAVPMEVDAVIKGKGKGNKGPSAPSPKGKGRGRGQGKGRGGGSPSPWVATAPSTSWSPPQQVAARPPASQQRPRGCYQCGALDHFARSCPLLAKGAGRGRGIGQRGGATFAAQPFQGLCRRCGRPGHKAAQCRVNLSNISVEEPPLEVSVGGPAGHAAATAVGALEPATQSASSRAAWLFALDASPRHGFVDLLEETLKLVLLLVDSGAYTHVCPPSFAAFVLMTACPSGEVAQTATGYQLRELGQRTVWLDLPGTGSSFLMRVVFRVMNIRKPILSVGSLAAQG